jgi:foldase protein PrsA
VTKGLRYFAALGAVLFALIGLAACGGIPGNAVVQVNGSTTISKDAFGHWMSVAASSGSTATGEKPVVPDPPNFTACIAHLQKTAPKPEKGQKAPTAAQLKTQCQQQYKSLQQEVLGFLISSSWVLGEGKSLGVKVSDKEVHKEFEKIRSAQFPKAADFEKFLASSGQSVSDLLLRVKLNLLSQKLQKKVVQSKGTITSTQIKKYYEENKSRFGTPEHRTVEVILTKTEAAAKSAKAEIESGKSFSSVAKKVSIDTASKAKGGQLGEVIKGQDEKELDAAMFAAQPNKLGGPVKTPFGYYVYEVLSVKAATQQSLTAVEKTIKQQLQAQNQQKSLADFVKAFKKKWKGRTDCRGGFVVTDCKQFKEPKTKSVKTGATPAPAAPAPTTTK